MPDVVPALIAAAGERASVRFLEFFAATIRNPHTRRAYGRAVAGFVTWCDENRVPSITAVQPLHVAVWIEQQTRVHAAPTAKLRLAALRHLFDWLVTGQVLPTNPAGSVRGPSHVVKAGKTPVLAPEEARALIDRIEITTPVGLRDRALIGLMVFSFARISAALGMKVEDVFTQNRRLWVRLRETRGKAHAMPCHHNLETYLTAYIEGRGHRRRSQGAAVPNHRPRHRVVDAHAAAPGQRLRDDRPARGGGRHRDLSRQSQLPRDRDHRVFEERRHAGEGGAGGEPCQHAHDAALRPSARGTQLRRGGADQGVAIPPDGILRPCAASDLVTRERRLPW
jgi:site-specific recombinase XerC